MQLSNLKRLTVGKNVYCDENIIILYLPSSDRKVWQGVYKTPFLFSNCKGIVIPNKIFKMYKKTFNGRVHYLDAKKQFLENKHALKKVPVVGSITPLETKTEETKKQKQFYFYDLSMPMDALKFFAEKIPERKVFQLFIDELRKNYNLLKEHFPDKKILIVADLTSPLDLVYVFLKNFKQLKNLIPESLGGPRFFDKFFYVSINKRLVPTLEYDEKGILVPILPMINKLDQFIEADELADEIDGVPAISDHSVDHTEPDQPLPNKSLVSKIVDTLADPLKMAARKNFVENPPTTKPATLQAKTDDKKPDDKITVELDSKTLSKVMKYYKVTNPDIIANVKAAIDEYIKETGKVPSKTSAELLVLKAVNKSIYGTDEIDSVNLANPNLLFDKLKEVNVFSVPLEMPDNGQYPFSIADVIPLKYTTGQHRQSYEFKNLMHEQIEKVFKVLENQQHPIKVLGITWEYKDDDTTRYTEYTIKLKNLDGNKRTYEVKLHIPAILNDKYFKIGGNKYIFSNQQHFKPLTKTKKDRVRLLTNYSTMEESIENLKFNVSDTYDILKYIQQRYPSLLVSVNENEAEFNNGDKIYLTGNQVLKTLDSDVFIDPDTNKLVQKGHEDKPFKQSRSEFLYEFILAKIHDVNPEDSLTKTKKSIPYIAIYMSGIRMPLLIYLWSQKGLLSTLNTFGINYLITEDRGEEGEVILELDNKKFLVLRPESIKERLIVNGLLASKVKYPIPEKDLDNPEIIHQHLSDTYGARVIFLINNITINIIDPITKELLQYENQPTNLPGILAGPALDMLLNKKVSKLSDLNIYRTRMSEVILRILYKQLTRAANSYAHKVEFGDQDARLMIVPEFVINEFMGKNPPDQVVERTANSAIELIDSVNPIDEIMSASKIIKTGPGGLANKDQIVPAHRNTDVTQIGTAAAIATPESANVGIITYHTLTPLILNKYGSYGVKNPDKVSNWDTVCATEALVPLLNQIHADRAVLAVTHSKQITPVSGMEVPLVMTGAEQIMPQLVSTRFAIRGKNDGVVTEVIPDETMTVQYKDGTKEVLDILPRRSRTKRGAYISLEMEPLEVGTKFKKNQLLASTKNFDNKTSSYMSGKNVTLAMMSYLGYTYEDGYAISDRVTESTKTDTMTEVSVIVPQETKVFHLEKQIGKMTDRGEDLVTFAFEEDLNNYLLANEFDVDDEDTIESFGNKGNNISLKSPGGKIVDIKVYINDRTKMDSSLIKLHKELAERINRIHAKIIQDKHTPYDKLTASDNLETKFLKIGGHKQKGNEFRGIKVTYYIKTPKPLRVGEIITN